MRTTNSARAIAVSLVTSLFATLAFASLAPPAAAKPGFTLTRLNGNDRYGTAAVIAGTVAPTAEHVLLATGEKFADALSGGYLAGVGGTAILLTQSNTLPAVTADALEDLGAERVTILGGTQAVSAAVQAELEADGYTVDRVQGIDRYATAQQAATSPGAAAVGEVDGLRTAVVASGERHPDAVSAAPLSYAASLPTLLTEAARLPAPTRAALEDLEIEQVLIPGGPVAVSQAVQNEIESLGIDVVRFAGESRTDTAALVADYAIDTLGFSATHINIARGDDFADALAGGPHAGMESSPTILTESPTVLSDFTRTWLEERSPTLEDGHLFGGPQAISDIVRAQIIEAATGESTEPVITVTGGPENQSFTNDSTPTFSGEASDSDGNITAVQVAVDTQTASSAGVTCTGCPSPSVTWEYTPQTPLADGNHTFAFTAVADSSTVSAPVTRTVTIDTKAPTFDSVQAAGGSRSIQAIFSEPLNCGTVSAGDFVVHYDTTTTAVVTSVECAAPASSSVTLTMANAPTAGQQVDVTVNGDINDRAGNAVAKPTKRTTVAGNQSPPTIAVTSGPPNGGSTNDDTPTYGGTASDSDGTVSQVQVRVDGGTFGTSGVNCTGCGTNNVTWSYTPTSALSAGSHSFDFRAVDNGGAFSNVVTRTVTVDTGAPVFNSISATGGNDVVPATFSEPLLCSSVQASDFTAEVDNAPVAVESVTCQDSTDSVIDLTLATAPPGGAVVEVTLAANSVTDPAGNAAAGATKTATASNSAPTINITSGPADNSFIQNSTPTWTGTASDSDGSVSRIEVSRDGGSFSQTGVTCTGCGTSEATWSYTPASAFSQGTHTVAFRSVDNAGATSPTVSRTFTVDTERPTFDSVFAEAGSRDVRANFSEPLSCTTVSDADFTVTIDGAPVGHDVTCDAPADSVLTLTVDTDVSAGDQVSVTLQGEVRDRAGHTAPAPTTRSTNAVANPPTVTITGGPANGGSTNDNTPTFFGTATDTDGVVTRVEVKVDNEDFSTTGVTCTNCGSSSASWSYTRPDGAPLSNGQHTFVVRAFDNAGNESAHASRTFTVDTTAPQFVSVEATAANPMVIANFSEALLPSSVQSGDFEAEINGQAVPILAASASGSQVTLTLAVAPPPTSTVEITLKDVVTDAAGNVAPFPTTKSDPAAIPSAMT